MKSIFSALCLLIATQAFAAEQELALKMDASGKPHFGIVYAYDFDVTWTFTYTTTITNQTLSTLPNAMFWNVVDTNTNQAFTDWTPIGKADLMASSLGISSKSVIANLLPKLKTAKVVFGSKNAQGNVDVLFSIPVGPLCQNYPSQFMDLTNVNKPACTVTSQDIPNWENECKEFETQLLDYIKQGILPCAIAQQQFAKRGCGDLTCQ